MTMTIGIVGGGIGGLSAAIALRQKGHEVVVFEQTRQFLRVGADINLTPNAVRALDGLGVGDALRESAARPTHRISRTWDTGEETSRLAMGDTAEDLYGAPQLTTHRADLLKALEARLPPEVLLLGKRATDIVNARDLVTVRFADGTERSMDALIGADGIHSVVRTALFGPESPQFTGVVAYRAVVPRERLSGSQPGRLHEMVGSDLVHSDRDLPAQPGQRNLHLRHHPAGRLAPRILDHAG